MTEAELLQNEVLALEVAMNSLVDFRRIFLPAPDERKPADFHFEWDDILLNGKGNFAIEAFRESAKSQLVIRAHMLYRLMFPSIEYDYVLFILANQRMASKKLKEIADEYLSNPTLCSNLVRIKEQSDKAFEVIVKDIYGKEMSVRLEAYGKGASVRGVSYKDKRPKLVCCDDLQDADDARSETVTDTDWDWFLSDIMFLGQRTRIFMIGNNLGESCLIERVFANNEMLNFKTMRIPVMVDGKSTWPDKYDVAAINKERENYSEIGKLDLWFREKMCQCISPDSQLFKEEMLKFYRLENLKLSDLSVFITVDLAISQRKEADHTVICVCGVNSQNHWFILDIDYGHYNPSETIDHIFKAVSKWNPVKVGVEKVAYQASMEHFLLKEMPTRNIFFSIVPLKADSKKEERIKLLQPRFYAGSIWLPANAPWLKQFKSEFLAFPKGLRDDVLDALAYMEQIALAPVKRRTVLTSNQIAGSM